MRASATEDARPLDAGTARFAFGGTWSHAFEDPVYGLTGTLLQAPVVEADLGLGGVAELQVSGGLRTLWISERRPGPLSSILDIPGSRSSAPQDVVIATKVRLARAGGWRPALGVQFATKLPNAGNESGLGTDTTDFSFVALATWVSGPWTVSANLGTAIVGDPSQIGVQHDPTLYAMQVARRVNERTEIAGEVSGRWLPGHPNRPGSEDRGDARFGVRRRIASWRVDASVLTGLTGIDPSIGVAVTVTRTFAIPFP